MKPILLLIMIALFPTPQERTEEPDLSVVKFSWAKDKPKTSMIRGAQNPGGPITTPITNDRDLGSRKSDLRIMEKKAAVSADPPGGDIYLLRLQLKNTGTNIIRNLVWEFRPTAGPDDYQPKQYLCGLHLKPKEKRILDVWTPYAPVKVVNVDAVADALKDGNVVINKIEYADGSEWKKAGWNYRLPAGASQKLSDGRCSVF